MTSTDTRDARKTRRERHTVVLRHLTVLRTLDLSPSIRRVTLTGAALDGFASPGFDDHVKMFFAAPGQDRAVLPSVGPDGLEFPESGPQPLGRDLTPRRYDPAARELDIDFALLHEGPASRWAASAKPGDLAWIAGPRGSILVPVDFDWHLLVADETGLPALARRLEELPADSRAVALIEVDGAADELVLDAPEGAQIVWVHRVRGTEARDAGIVAALREIAFPEGDYFAWIATESGLAKQLRGVLVDERGADRRWVRAHGYWRSGTAAVHDDFDD
ncbi:siderophore-interacting protein [Methylorubrum zatmanii]|uniref:Siderophore-interacting protein n=1 Tax=Methylorubrum zatmanii TaxID=29429 RepID=A0ABW1WRL1_9HYPH|nr:siderophore-interacting protein [Methylorubrum zatmanii]MBD8908562.1 NADPH-dependent ferric siderophore reductase [Methylorubrum zatmanii]